MKRGLTPVVMLLVAWLIGGCSITGTWKTVKVEPEDATGRGPFQMVTFAEDGQYSATHQYGDEVRTSTGTYTWGWGKLTIKPHDEEARQYAGGYSAVTKQLVLSHQVEGQKVTATLEKYEDLPK
jgi:hypothetical protein